MGLIRSRVDQRDVELGTHEREVVRAELGAVINVMCLARLCGRRGAYGAKKRAGLSTADTYFSQGLQPLKQRWVIAPDYSCAGSPIDFFRGRTNLERG